MQWKASASPVVFVPYRIAAECSLLLFLCTWAFGIASWFHSRGAPSCAPPHAHSGVGRSPVAIVSGASGMAFTIYQDGFVRMDAREVDEPSELPTRQAFHLEWQQPPQLPPVSTSPQQQPTTTTTTGGYGYFCLRWMRDMRLVQVASPGDADEHMLKLSNRYACDERAAFFAFRGSSLYSLGAESYINVRDEWHVRAHGDEGPPWKPLQKETSRSRLLIEPLPDRRDYVERSLLELVTRLERNVTLLRQREVTLTADAARARAPAR